MEPKDWIALGGLLSGVIVFGGGLWQYAKTQRWKRAEFVASLVKDFESRAGVRLAQTMLDRNSGEVDLFPDASPSKRAASVTDDIVRVALTPDTKKSSYNEKESAIVEAFDEFFDGLEADSSSARKSKVLRAAIREHLSFYRYTGVLALFGAYGYHAERKESPG
jgi:hypothetical protein